jgi:Mg/Co/Ni transporter MgtE
VDPATQTIAEAHAAIRAAPPARDNPYFYVLDDNDRLAGVVSARHRLTGALDQRVEQVMNPGVLTIPSWATVLIASGSAPRCWWRSSCWRGAGI